MGFLAQLTPSTVQCKFIRLLALFLNSGQLSVDGTGSLIRKFRLPIMMIGRIHFLPIKCESSPITKITPTSKGVHAEDLPRFGRPFQSNAQQHTTGALEWGVSGVSSMTAHLPPLKTHMGHINVILMPCPPKLETHSKFTCL